MLILIEEIGNKTTLRNNIRRRHDDGVRRGVGAHCHGRWRWVPKYCSAGRGGPGDGPDRSLWAVVGSANTLETGSNSDGRRTGCN